ncbi:MAG: hypothetical protein ABR559_03205 [Gemmatimonadota bacterium]
MTTTVIPRLSTRARLARLLEWLTTHSVAADYCEVAGAEETEVGLSARGVAALGALAEAAAALHDPTVIAIRHRSALRLTVLGSIGPQGMPLAVTVPVDGQARDALLARLPTAATSVQTVDVATLRDAAAAVESAVAV